MNLNTLKNHALTARDFIIELIFPRECFSCGQEGKWLCRKCFRAIKINARQVCIGCNALSDLGKTCPSCRAHLHLRGVLVASSYDDKLVNEAIKSLKYGFVRELSDDLGEIMSIFLRDMINISKINLLYAPRLFRHIRECIVIPIPLHQRRLRFRGFNQAEILAERIADNFDLELSKASLVRLKYGRPQAKLPVFKRSNNIKGVFSWVGGSLQGKRIILVDDVATTGATLNEAAVILRQAGAKEVWGLVAAKG